MTTSDQGAASALFISDLHLQPSQPRTTAAFLDFMARRAMHAQRLYLLGDLFEYWAGDDDIDDPYHQQIIAAIRRASDAGVAVFWIAGNRYFLVGARFSQAGASCWPTATPSAPRTPSTWNSAPWCASPRGNSSSPRCRWRSARPSSPACARTAARTRAARP